MDPLLPSQVLYALQHRLYDDAIFHAERNHAFSATANSLHLLATAHFCAAEYHRAYSLLNAWRLSAKPGWSDPLQPTSDSLALLFSQCALRIDKLREAKESLHPDGAALPESAVARHVLGTIYRRLGNVVLAIECFQMALKANPFLITAVKHLTELGGSLDNSMLCTADHPYTQQLTLTTHPSGDTVEPTQAHIAPRNDEFETPESRETSMYIDAQTPGASVNHSQTPVHLMQMPQTQTQTPLTPLPGNQQMPSLVQSRIPPPSNRSNLITGGYSIASHAMTKLNYSSVENTPSPGRGSNSLFSVAPLDTTAASNSTPTTRTTPRKSLAFSFFQKKTEPKEPPSPGAASTFRITTPTTEICALYTRLARAMMYQNKFVCTKVAEELMALDASQRNTGWVQCQIGRAYVEMEEYEKANQAFRDARRLDPSRIRDLDLYSTTLYKLNKDVDLTHLANQVVESDRLSPESWCIAGNSLGLQRDHANAIKMFKRAIQLDPYYAYPHTLIGLEYFAIKEYEKSMTYFRKAISIDPRHYRAWLGIGQVYLTQDNLDLAEYHFQRVLSIHKSSYVFNMLGMLMSKIHTRKPEALGMLDQALQLQPKNSLARFTKAYTLYTLNRIEEAVKELEVLTSFYPREAKAHFLLSRAYKKLGNHSESLMSYQLGYDLDPSGHSLRGLSETDEDEDQEFQEQEDA